MDQVSTQVCCERINFTYSWHFINKKEVYAYSSHSHFHADTFEEMPILINTSTVAPIFEFTQKKVNDVMTLLYIPVQDPHNFDFKVHKTCCSGPVYKDELMILVVLLLSNFPLQCQQ
jgi:hypothetical protein